MHIINRDVPFVPQEAGFPLSLLIDAWLHLDGGFLASIDCPFTKEQAKNITAGMRLKNEFRNLYELIFGYRYGISPPSGDTHGNAEEYSQCATDIVTSYDISPYQNVPLWSEVIAFANRDEPWDPEEPDGPADLDDSRVWKLLRDRELPYAEISVTVSDAGYLEHMIAGMCWDTTMMGYVC
ncbi:hypothetical protein ACWCQP_37390 [Streptomyces chartreusis]